MTTGSAPGAPSPGEDPTHGGADPENVEEAGRHGLRVDALRLSLGHQVDGAGHVQGDVLQSVGALPIQHVQPLGHGQLVLTVAAQVLDRDQRLRVFEGKGGEHDPVHQGEDRRVRADPQRQGDHGDGREHGVSRQASGGESKVVEQARHLHRLLPFPEASITQVRILSRRRAWAGQGRPRSSSFFQA
jgi:hypothetical protein